MELNADTREYAQLVFERICVIQKGEYKLYMENNNPCLEVVDVVAQITRATSKGISPTYLKVCCHIQSKQINSHLTTCGMKVYQGGYYLCDANKHLYTPEDLEDTIKTISDNIEHLIYDKKYDRFIISNNPDLMQENRIRHLERRLFKHVKSVKPDEICCVCQEITENKTTCGHHLCGDCWERLDQLRCPMCREDCSYCDEDEEEE
jgi:hypothetical protein